MPAHEPKTPHEGAIEIGVATNVGAPQDTGTLSARFSRYAGCQQLMLWLPQPGERGYHDLLVAHVDGRPVERSRVRDRLHGSVKILFDTLSWPAGDYCITIAHDDGWRHELALRKFHAGVAALAAAVPSSRPSAARAKARLPAAQGVERINAHPDEALLTWHAGMHTLAQRLSRKLAYEGSFRAGKVIYIEGDTRIPFLHEAGGGLCRFKIQVPPAAQWEAHTGAPLAQREEIVHFVADSVLADLGSVGRFEITPDSINWY